ncbi:unnamed protein product, partial [Rotaria magnacalcarata]
MVAAMSLTSCYEEIKQQQWREANINEIKIIVDYITRMASEPDSTSETRKLREVYPAIEPYNTGMLKVSEIHTLYYEEVGNPAGKPIVFVHGGPGGGT